jgi:group I intron endonuclease
MYTGRIYRIDNLENTNFYIGQTRNTLLRRFTDHKSQARRGGINMILYNAMRKYGPDMFTIEDIEVIQGESKKELVECLNEKEKYHIQNLKPTYNIAPGGIGHTGVPWTYERRIRFKKLMSGERNPNFGKPLSEETKSKLRDALKGRIIPDDVRQKTSKTMKGVPKSEETRKRMSEARKGYNSPKGKESKKAIPVDQYDKDGNFIKSFGSIADAADELGCQRSGICFCLKGRIKTSAGFIWKYHSLCGGV